MTSYAQEWQVDLEKARGTLQSLHGPGAERKVGRLARLVDDLEDRLVTMERKPIDYAVGQGELARRRVALDALRRDVNALGGGRTSGGFPPALGGSGGGGGAGRGSRLEQQQETMREHDRMLEELSQGVGRLKTQSTLINEETSLHVRLLDDMEGDAATASAGLRSEARHAEKIRSKTKTFNLYVIIVILTVILAILIFAGI